jgi:hypothetical protein
MAAIEARNLLPATLREGHGQRTLRRLVAASGARKSLPQRWIRKTAPELAIRSDAFAPKPWSDVIGRIRRPPSARRSSQLSAGRVQPALT